MRILINIGTNARPQFDETPLVHSKGDRIVIHIKEVFPGLDEYGHNMGYPHSAFVDWDDDGLPEVMVPNITNRVFWYINVGTPADATCEDSVAQRRQKAVDQVRCRSELALRLAQPLRPKGEFNDDALVDMVATDGQGPAMRTGIQTSPCSSFNTEMTGSLTVSPDYSRLR